MKLNLCWLFLLSTVGGINACGGDDKSDPRDVFMKEWNVKEETLNYVCNDGDSGEVTPAGASGDDDHCRKSEQEDEITCGSPIVDCDRMTLVVEGREANLKEDQVCMITVGNAPAQVTITHYQLRVSSDEKTVDAELRSTFVFSTTDEQGIEQQVTCQIMGSGEYELSGGSRID